MTDAADDDWRGEHLIRGVRPDEHQRRSTSMSAVSSAVAERKRRAGVRPNASANHDAFYRSLLYRPRKEKPSNP